MPPRSTPFHPVPSQSIITLVEAHVTLVALLRSPSMCVPGIGPDGEWPPAAKRLAKLAWAVAYRVRKAAGAVESSMALADDDVMLLCQGLEVLEALEECSGEFFEGKRSKREPRRREVSLGRRRHVLLCCVCMVP